MTAQKTQQLQEIYKTMERKNLKELVRMTEKYGVRERETF
jgi:hypothetical protein